MSGSREYEAGYAQAMWDISEMSSAFRPEDTEFANGYNTAMNEHRAEIIEYEGD